MLTLGAIEAHRAGQEGWVKLIDQPMNIDLIHVNGVEQVLNRARIEPGRYTEVRLQVTQAKVKIGPETKTATLPSGELKLAGQFDVEAGKTTAITVDFDAEASVSTTGAGDVVIRPVAKLVTRAPSLTLPAVEFPAVQATGLLATLPDYVKVDLSEAADLVKLVYDGRVPKSLQVLVLVTQDDRAYLVLALDTQVDRFITAGTVVGRRAPPLKRLPPDLDFAGGVIVAETLTPMQPLQVTPDQVNKDARQYALKRVVMNTTYVFSGVRVKDAPPSLKQIGFGVATDHLGSKSRDDYLTVVDPYNTETQMRVPQLYGTVLYPTQGMRAILQQLYRFVPADVAQALDKPSLFYEDLKDDDPQLVNIGQLVPTPKDPTLKLSKYHGKIVSVQGIALGGMVRTEDIPQLKNVPIALTIKTIGAADLTGAMPIVGISSEDVSGEVFGNFRFDLSVYDFGDQKAFAFLIGKKAVPLDPVADVERASFGNRVKSSLSSYLVTQMETTKLASDITLEQVNLLLPADPKNSLIMTRHPALVSGDYLKTAAFDGYLIDAQFLGVPSAITSKYNPRVIVVNQSSISFEKGSPPLPAVPTPVTVPTPAPSPTPPSSATPPPLPSPRFP